MRDIVGLAIMFVFMFAMGTLFGYFVVAGR